MDLVADRFLVIDQESTIDLATGGRVELVVSASGGIAEQARWATRCERFARLHHRSIARLLDYGPFGEGRRYEAWRCDGRWRGSRLESERTRSHVEHVFRAIGWSSGFGADAIRSSRGHAIVLPGATAGYEAADTTSGTSGESTISVFGITEVSRESVRTIAETFSDRFGSQCRAVALCGPPGSGRDTAVMNLARTARLNGYLPVGSRLLRSELNAILDGRSVALFIRSDFSFGWRAFVHLALVSRKAHIAVFVGADRPRGVCGITLERVNAGALQRAVQPDVGRSRLGRRIMAAAKRARGLPGRFEVLAWGERDMQQSLDGSEPSRVAEATPQYGQETATIPAEGGGRVVEWPAPGELVILRKRLQTAQALACRGRHAAGDRALRQVGASLVRRHDWEHAMEANLALAKSLIRRGRPRDAQAVLIEARDAAIHVGQKDALNRIAILTGVALLDDGRLDEAEAVLSAVVAAANGLEDAEAHRSAILALARCQFWRGRFDSATGTLSRIDTRDADDQLAIRVAALRSRLAVGLGDFEQAIAQASTAIDRARSCSRPDLLALSAAAAAFAHLSVGDHPAVMADAALAIQMARRSHDPLLGLRARLVLAESHRRQGRRAPGLTLMGRIRRLKSHQLPFILRARVDLFGDLLTAEKDDAIVKRHSQTTGLAGLAAFAPVGHSLSQHVAAIADIVAILQCCQTADEETRMLVGLCARLKGQLQANGVAFFAEEAGVFTPIASDGVRIEPSLGPRLVAVDQPIRPHCLGGRFEAGAPVRYGGRRLGVLLARWSLGTSCESKDVVVLLATAATAAGPAVAGVLARRASTTPRTSDLIGLSESMVDVRSAIERASPAPFSVLVEGASDPR